MLPLTQMQGAFAMFQLHNGYKPLSAAAFVRLRMGSSFAQDVEVDLSSLHEVSGDKVWD